MQVHSVTTQAQTRLLRHKSDKSGPWCSRPNPQVRLTSCGSGISPNMQVAHHPGSSATAFCTSCTDCLAWRDSQSATAATAAREGAMLGWEGQKAPARTWEGAGGGAREGGGGNGMGKRGRGRLGGEGVDWGRGVRGGGGPGRGKGGMGRRCKRLGNKGRGKVRRCKSGLRQRCGRRRWTWEGKGGQRKEEEQRVGRKQQRKKISPLAAVC